MRIESAVTSVSWIPSEAVTGMTKAPFELGVAHYDDPPPDVIHDLGALQSADRFRFANELRAWIDVVDGRIVDHGYSPAFVTTVETALERELSRRIMRSGKKPRIKKVRTGGILVRQGEAGNELFLVLDGVVQIDVDGKAVAELGPGAILGERALLEGGRRTSTMRALTSCTVAVASAAELNPRALAEVSKGHRREHG
jgi:hypothetical protein